MRHAQRHALCHAQRHVPRSAERSAAAAVTVLWAAGAGGCALFGGEGIEVEPHGPPLLEPGTYSVIAEGAIEAEAELLSATDGDADIPERDVLEGRAPEKIVFGPDPDAPGATVADGPYRIRIVLGEDWIDADRAATAALQISLHVTGPLAPGSYPVTRHFLDRSDPEAPVSAYVLGVSPDRAYMLPFNGPVTGSFEIDRLGPDGATGIARFKAETLDRDRDIHVAASFEAIPFVRPAALDLRVAGLDGAEPAFETVKVQTRGAGLRFLLEPSGDGPGAEILLSRPPEARLYETAPAGPLTLLLDGKEASGTVRFTSADPPYAAEFVIDREDGATLTGRFSGARAD